MVMEGTRSLGIRKYICMKRRLWEIIETCGHHGFGAVHGDVWTCLHVTRLERGRKNCNKVKNGKCLDCMLWKRDRS